MSQKKPVMFRCSMCGGDVRLAAVPNRTYDFRPRQSFPIPDDFELPTCGSCGEWYMDSGLTRRLDKMCEEMMAKKEQEQP